MVIVGIRHRGLRRYIVHNDASGLRPDLVDRIQSILTALISAPVIEELRGPPGWRIHQLVGNRRRAWSISVSGNWRITFEIENGEITDLDLEDYH